MGREGVGGDEGWEVVGFGLGGVGKGNGERERERVDFSR